MTTGVAIGQGSGGDREMISLAYINAAKQVQDDTLDRLGLSSQHHQAIRRYEEIAAYRSPNPFKTETPFAKWLVEEKNNRPEKYVFWSKLYPICYGRSVEQSSVIF
ncbi:hypothetical protein PMG11_05020 [Penicillium brasilianum]|uniref:Uncharacterized protein n=1 Tax=Penicillium brasilianum TaxID=104259 RepID=A0A0F7VHF3_PENBI|nr:hypothetical protein PMG11_05020 [Penicillium brasilianum]